MPLKTDKPTNREDHFHWARELVEESKQRRAVWEAIMWQNIATYTGDFFTEYNIHERRLEPQRQRPEHRVRLPINLAQPVVLTEIAKLTKNRPIVDVIPTGNEERELNATEVAEGMLNDYCEYEFHLPRVRRRMLQWVFTCGSGGIFVDWDETLGDVLQIYEDKGGNAVVDEALIEAYNIANRKEKRRLGIRGPIDKPMGELSIREISPMAVGWDMSVNNIDDAKWAFISNVYETEEVYQRWGEQVEPNSKAVPGVIEKRMMSQLDLSGKLGLRDVKSQKLCIIHRLFVKPGHPWYPNGAHMVFTDEKMIHMEDFPYDHKEIPISMMGHVPLPVTQQSMSTLQQLRGPVLEISRTASQLVENRNLMANPPWLIPKQLQLRGDSIQNKPGARIEYNHIPNVPAPGPVTMPEMPTYVKELIPVMKDFIQLISGQGETSQGQSPAGVRSGVQIAYLQEADDTRLGPTSQEYEETIERSHKQILELIGQNYTLPRTVVMYHRHEENKVMDFMGSMIAGRISGVRVQAGSALPRAKAAKQQFILELWDRKIEQDPRRVQRMLELGEGEEEDWKVDTDQAERENRKLMRGEKPPVLEWYNHEAHQYAHRRWMKEPGFEQLPQNIQDDAMQHDALHTLQLQRQQMQQAQMEAMRAGSNTSPSKEEPQGPEGPTEAPTEGALGSPIDAQPQ